MKPGNIRDEIASRKAKDRPASIPSAVIGGVWASAMPSLARAMGAASAKKQVVDHAHGVRAIIAGTPPA